MSMFIETIHASISAGATFTIPQGFTEGSVYNTGTSALTVTNGLSQVFSLPAGASYTWSYRNAKRAAKVITTIAGGAAEITYEI